MKEETFRYLVTVKVQHRDNSVFKSKEDIFPELESIIAMLMKDYVTDGLGMVLAISAEVKEA